MVVKTPFSSQDFDDILAHYALGSYLRAEPVAQGTVQTNYFLVTTRGKFVFRYYENRSIGAVHFECQLLAYLKKHGYPSPAPLKNRHGTAIGVFHLKPYVLFEFMPGQPVDQPNELHQQQIIHQAAELQNLTRGYRPGHTPDRWNYSVGLCRTLGQSAATALGTQEAYDKLAWLDAQLSILQLPRSLPKGICHCDFHFSNVLFQADQFVALLDFDDANYTYLLFDLVGLIEAGAWQHPRETLEWRKAREIVREYQKVRPLNTNEQRHLFDVYRLSILIDCVWYFGRGRATDFYEKRKIEFLNQSGRDRFFEMLFLKGSPCDYAR